MIGEMFNSGFPDLEGKSVLVTGGTGSFGRAFVKTLSKRFNPRRIGLYSRDEHDHFNFQNSLNDDEKKIFRSYIGDVRDVDRLSMAFQRVDVVIHAAALKQVPLAEYNPFECIRTNVIGAQNIVQAAIRAGVPKVLALSTDKAVNPINLYGASKLASDKIFVAGNSLASGTVSRFSVVRYGNVVGSRGSVIPFFKDLIEKGATELPITDPRMTRFWITLQDSVNFVLSSLSLMQGGEIFVPKIPSVGITDLAKAMAPDLPHKIVGIRPGEKLHELMVDQYSSRHTVDIGDRYVIEPEWQFWPRDGFADMGKKVPDEFEYRSDNNDWTLNADEVRDMIAYLGDMGE